MTTAVQAGRGVELLDAAVLEFLENGYADVGVREITERAGVSHGTFYNYFENKRQMLSVLIDREFSELLELTSEADAHEEGPITESSLRELMVAVSTHVLARVAERLDVFSFLLMQAPGVDAEALDEFVRLYYEGARRADLILQRGRDAGIVADDLDHAYVSEAWVSFVFSVVAAMITDVTDSEPAHAAEILVGLLLDGAVGAQG